MNLHATHPHAVARHPTSLGLSPISPGRSCGAREALHAANAELIQMPQQVRRILVDPIRARALQFFLAVATGEQAHSQGASPPGGQQIPDTVPHDNRLVDGHAEPRRGGDEQVRVRLGVFHLLPVTTGTAAPTPRSRSAGPALSLRLLVAMACGTPLARARNSSGAPGNGRT